MVHLAWFTFTCKCFWGWQTLKTDRKKKHRTTSAGDIIVITSGKKTRPKSNYVIYVSLYIYIFAGLRKTASQLPIASCFGPKKEVSVWVSPTGFLDRIWKKHQWRVLGEVYICNLDLPHTEDASGKEQFIRFIGSSLSLRFGGRNDGGFVMSVAKIFITDDESHGRKVCPSEI